jgi:hypothetical protein
MAQQKQASRILINESSSFTSFFVNKPSSPAPTPTGAAEIVRNEQLIPPATPTPTPTPRNINFTEEVLRTESPGLG